MRKNLIVKGMVIGAIVGGALTLFDRDTRLSVNQKIKTTNRKTNYYLHHPSEFVAEVRNQYQAISETLIRGIDTTLAYMADIQRMIDQEEQK